MFSVSQFIHNIDLGFYYFLSQAHGNWYLDRFAFFEISKTLFKSIVLIAAYWYFWFKADADWKIRRKSILTIMAATLVGLTFTRAMATALPFRIRPLYDQTLVQYPLSYSDLTEFENWNSFPSDHATYLGALACGLVFLSRRLRIPVAAYFAFWICLPRLYLGLHYLSDVVAGATIGAGTVWVGLRMGVQRSRWAQSMLEFVDTKPQWFYPLAFLALYEMGVLFWDVRSAIRSLMTALSGV